MGNDVKNGGAPRTLTSFCTWCLVCFSLARFLYLQPCSGGRRHHFVDNGSIFASPRDTEHTFSAGNYSLRLERLAQHQAGRQSGLLPERGWVGCWLQATPQPASGKSRSPDVVQTDVPLALCQGTLEGSRHPPSQVSPAPWLMPRARGCKPLLLWRPSPNPMPPTAPR